MKAVRDEKGVVVVVRMTFEEIRDRVTKILVNGGAPYEINFTLEITSPAGLVFETCPPKTNSLRL